MSKIQMMGWLACVALLSHAGLRDAAAELARQNPGASRPVAARPLLIHETMDMIGRTNFHARAASPEYALENLEDYTRLSRRDEPRAKARAEAARYVIGLLAHPEEIERQKAALKSALMEQGYDYPAGLLKEAADDLQRRASGKFLAVLKGRFPAPQDGLDGAAKRLDSFYDGWTERWSAPARAGADPEMTRYRLKRPSGRTQLDRLLPAESGNPRVDPLKAEARRLVERIGAVHSSMDLGDNPVDAAGTRLIGWGIALGAPFAAMFSDSSLLLLCSFLPMGWGALMIGRSLAKGHAQEIDEILENAPTTREAVAALTGAHNRLRGPANWTQITGFALLAAAGLRLIPLSEATLWDSAAALVRGLAGMGFLGACSGMQAAQKLAAATAELLSIEGLRKGVRARERVGL